MRLSQSIATEAVKKKVKWLCAIALITSTLVVDAMCSRVYSVGVEPLAVMAGIGRLTNPQSKSARKRILRLGHHTGTDHRADWEKRFGLKESSFVPSSMEAGRKGREEINAKSKIQIGHNQATSGVSEACYSPKIKDQLPIRRLVLGVKCSL